MPQVPGPRTPSALLTLRFVQRPWVVLDEGRRRFGDVFALRLGMMPGPLIVVSDPELIKQVFTGDPELLRAGEGNAVLEPVVGPHSVLLLDGKAHLRERRLLLGPFRGERMALYGERIAAITAEEVARWPVGSPFPLHPPMRAITLKVILRVVFGIDDADRMAELERLLARMLDVGEAVTLMAFLQHDLGGLSPWGRFLRAREAVDAAIHAEIARRREDPTTPERNDILSLLLQARHEDGSPMTDGELRDELVTMLVAGHETTATGLAWTFERLVRHPGVLARLVDELETGEDPYLDAVVKESLRVRPVLNFAMRRVAAPYELGGYDIPAGATIGACIHLLHRRADLYPEPLAFRPERFIERPAETYSWLPFGGGVRRCLGAAFATFEMKLVLREVLARVELAPVSAAGERRKRRAITTVPADGARVTLRARRYAASMATWAPAASAGSRREMTFETPSPPIETP